MWKPEERFMKVYARELFLVDAPSRCKHYLTLAGEDCQDVKEAYESNRINSETLITSAEKNGENHEKMLAWFAKNKSMFKNKPRLHKGEMCEVSDLEPVDLVFLDYVGNLTAPDCVWINDHLAPSIVPNGYLGITVAINTRGNRFIPNLTKMLKQKYPELYKKNGLEIRESKGSLPANHMRFVTTYTILLRHYLFANWSYDFNINWYGEKESSYQMFLFRLSNMRREKNNKAPIENKLKIDIDKLVNNHRNTGIFVSAMNVPISFEARSSPMSASSPIVGSSVISALMKAKTPGKKAAATRMLNAFCQQRHNEDGVDPKWVHAGIKARITRIKNAA